MKSDLTGKINKQVSCIPLKKEDLPASRQSFLSTRIFDVMGATTLLQINACV